MIASTLQKVESGELKRVMFFMPPRHGKSELISIRFPVWYLGRNPHKRIIACSYSDELASDFGGKARDLAQSDYFRGVFPRIKIANRSASKQQWDLVVASDHYTWHDKGGGYVSAGVGGAITGRGADIFLIDDPIKNQAEAESPTYRSKVWEWYKSTAYTRLEKDAAIILIQTRWHGEDLAGKLLEAEKNGGESWHIVSLPAVAINDEVHRRQGDALWREKYDLSALDGIRRTIGTRYWSALYQQNPTEDEGNIIKRAWWKRYAPNYLQEKKAKRVIQSWDTMYGDDELERLQKKTDKQLAYNAMTEWAEYDDGYYLTNVSVNQETFPDLTRTVMGKFKERNPRAVLIEDKASGRSLIQSLMRSTRIPIIPVNPGAKNKVTRVHAEAPTIEGGRCFIPLGQMGDDFIEYCAAFPGGAAPCADVVDTTTQALHYMTKSGIWTSGG